MGIKRRVENVRELDCGVAIFRARSDENEVDSFAGRQTQDVGEPIDLLLKMTVICPPDGLVVCERIVDPGIAEMRDPR